MLTSWRRPSWLFAPAHAALSPPSPERAASRAAGQSWLVGLLLWSLLLVSGPLTAQGAPLPGAKPASSTASQPLTPAGSPAEVPVWEDARLVSEDEAALKVFNREVFQFRAAVLGLGPVQRQKRAEAQIRHALAQPHAPLMVSVQASAESRAILIDGHLAFWVLQGDLLPETSLDGAAAQAAQALRLALAERREAGNWQGLLWSAVQVVAALLLLWPALWLLRRANAALHRWLARRAADHAGRLRVGGVTLLSGDRLMEALRTLARLVYGLGLLVMAYEWLSWSLQRFPYTRPLGERLQALLLDSLGLIGAAAATALPNLIVALLILLLAHFLLSMLKPFFARAEAGAVDLGWLNADTARPTLRLVQVVVWIFAVAMAYPYLPGAQSEAFKGLSVLVGLMVSLGATSVIGQAAAGLILMYTRTLRVGEYIKVGEHEGTVMEMGSFATRVRTGLGEELTLPNALIASSVTRNYSRAVTGQGFVCDVSISIGYDTPWRQVEALLMLAAARTPGVLADPKPRVFQTQLADFYVCYRLVVQAKPSEPGPRAQVINALHAQVQDVFNEFGVQIMSPHYLGDPASAKLVPRERWHEAPARGPAPGDATP